MSAPPDARRIVAALEGRWTGRAGMCRCPAHEDRDPSMSVSQTRLRRLEEGLDMLARFYLAEGADVP